MNNGEHWQPYEGGKTIGMTGSEGGTIVRDDEHSDGARLTLERDCPQAPYAISCSIYGWAVHSRYFADEPTAQHNFDAMQPALAAILALLPYEDDPDAAAKAGAVSDAIAAFVERFP